MGFTSEWLFEDVARYISLQLPAGKHPTLVPDFFIIAPKLNTRVEAKQKESADTER